MFIPCKSAVKGKILPCWVEEKSLKERRRDLGKKYLWISSSNA
jgi:hypothetical protein